MEIAMNGQHVSLTFNRVAAHVWQYFRQGFEITLLYNLLCKSIGQLIIDWTFEGQKSPKYDITSSSRNACLNTANISQNILLWLNDK